MKLYFSLGSFPIATAFHSGNSFKILSVALPKMSYPFEEFSFPEKIINFSLLGNFLGFSIAGYNNEQVNQKFSGMINALSYGAPPHGGIAPGIDRIVMLLANEKNIREVTLFPLNQNEQDLMMNAPSEIDEKQLKELNIKKDIKKN